MEIRFENKMSRAYQEVGFVSKRVQENAECVVPDTEEDIGKIASVQADVLLKSKDLGGRGVLVSGEARAFLLVITEQQNKLSLLRLSKTFTVDLELPEQSAELLTLSERDKDRIREKKYTAAISFHYTGKAWMRLQEKGIRKVFDAGDLAGADYVIAATGSTETDAAVAEVCRVHGVPVNTAGDAAQGDFYLPATIKDGPLIVAVSTSGTSPAYARRLREQKKQYASKVKPQEEDNPEPPTADEIKVGARVNVLSAGQKGTVVTLPDSKGDFMVQVGSLKLGVNLSGVTLVQENVTEKQRTKTMYSRMYASKSMSVPMSVNVVGQNLDDAQMTVDKYLDDAFMAGLETVSIIHGRGAGILKNGIQQMLKHHKHVKSFRKGEYKEGGDGVTIVTLKR